MALRKDCVVKKKIYPSFVVKKIPKTKMSGRFKVKYYWRRRWMYQACHESPSRKIYEHEQHFVGMAVLAHKIFHECAATGQQILLTRSVVEGGENDVNQRYGGDSCVWDYIEFFRHLHVVEDILNNFGIQVDWRL